ncbi:MAG: sigma-70 family RNA polymerase sigma factor [Chitinophagales bacterium]|nr:sigma-70 family RNA polymerase sigma factor [Chitinophagales bacterium]
MEDQVQVSAVGNSDIEIIAGILAGEKKLFGLLIRKYNSRLYRTGMAIINNDTEVEDIMQTSYITAYENLSKFENRSSFGTWLVRIMINESILQLKKRKRFIYAEGENIEMDAVNRLNNSNGPQTPSGFVINKELAHALETSLSAIPEKYRLVFVMREIETMSIAETAHVLNISETNVKVRLNRAKVMLRQKLNSYYKSEDVYHFHLRRCTAMVERVFYSLKLA